jgi:SAM-dependent methyltransferase
VYTALVQPRARVTAADIARLAGVGRAAVSNWRKRYTSFPAPVGGTDASPQFDLEQVERWLVEENKIPAVADEDRLWRNLLAAADDPAEALALAGEQLGGVRELPFAGLRSELATLTERHGERGGFEELWSRFADLPGQRAVTTPDPLAELMIRLAEPDGGSVLDPACGTGRLLRAASRDGASMLYGQDIDPAATRLAQLWLTMNERDGEISTGDSLRHDAFPDLTVDAVVANLPFGLTNWGHEELGYDRRWEFGVPPRTEPELAWVQHALAHLKPDRRAVLLMPPSAASRRAGRRIRAELLRRGAIRAIVALPPGAAAPHAIGLHLWVLQRTAAVAGMVYLVDVAADAVDEAYRKIVGAVAGGGHAVPVIDLLDEDVDLTPGRHGPGPAPGAGMRESRERLTAIVGALPGLLPQVRAEEGGSLPSVTVGELVRAGQVQLLGPVKAGTEPGAGLPVLVSEDVANGRAAAEQPEPMPRIDLRAGDVVVPVLASHLHVRVLTDGGVLLGRGLYLLRSDPELLDPWFLAGYLRTSANERQAGSSSSSGWTRFDPRRARVPRVPIEEQRRHGEVFRRLQEFDDAVREAAALSGELSRQTADSLASGFAQP